MPRSITDGLASRLLSIENLHVDRSGSSVLSDISISFGTGLHGLLGVNGAGKTSALLTVAGVLKPRSGTVTVCGLDPYVRRERSDALRNVALVPQDLDAPKHMRLGEYLQYIAGLRSVPRKGRREAAERASSAVALDKKLGQRMETLSGGMIRRALIAQALIADAPVLLFDESTSGLDPTQRAEVRSIIKTLSESRCCILASHIIEDIRYLAGRVVVLHGGQIRFDGTPQELEERAVDVGSGGSRMERAFMELTAL